MIRTTWLILLLLIIGFISSAEENNSDGKWVDFGSPGERNFFVGIELAELAQRDFTDLGINNFTFHAGQRFKIDFPLNIGWSFLAYKVDLSDEHLQNEDQVFFIDGDRTKLTGETGAANLWFDISYNLLSFIRIKDRYILRIIPEFGIGLGYGMWGFTNIATEDAYKLEALTLLARVNLRTTLFDLIYIDYPFWNSFIYLTKSRPVYGDLSGVEINRPEYYGMTALMTLGVIFNY